MVGCLEKPGSEQAKEREAKSDKDVLDNHHSDHDDHNDHGHDHGHHDDNLGPVVHEDDIPNIEESVATQDSNKSLRDPLPDGDGDITPRYPDITPEPKIQFSKQLVVFWVPVRLLLLAQGLPSLLCFLRVLRK